ncbi:MAG TPA: stalk domain-containing protein [Mobilitalea sp.]|nr:stalk domain-containing protein [Mobilitalea sp.]
MKRILCIILTAVLILTPASIASAKQTHGDKEHNQKTTHEQEKQKIKEKKQSFKIDGSPVIKYERYKLPINPVVKGMGANVSYVKSTGVLTVTKDTTTIVIDFKNKTVTVNGVADTNSSIFTSKSSKKTTVLIQYIAKILGVKVTVDDDKVTVTTPVLDYPTNVTVTPVGDSVVANTLNTTTLYMTATANIIAGQATGGKAELYVGTKLVATDNAIAATDTTVTFTTSDGTPTNEELQAAVPTSGIVTVKLYNASSQCVTSVAANPTLNVDYTAPTVTGVNSAVYSVSGSAITISISGNSTVSDKVDVTKISLYDTTLDKTYTLTDAAGTGSTGTINADNSLSIKLGSADQIGLAGFGSTTVFLNVNAGSLLIDSAGNKSASFSTVVSVPVTITQ